MILALIKREVNLNISSTKVVVNQDNLGYFLFETVSYS